MGLLMRVPDNACMGEQRAPSAVWEGQFLLFRCGDVSDFRTTPSNSARGCSSMLPQIPGPVFSMWNKIFTKNPKIPKKPQLFQRRDSISSLSSCASSNFAALSYSTRSGCQKHAEGHMRECSLCALGCKPVKVHLWQRRTSTNSLCRGSQRDIPFLKT